MESGCRGSTWSGPGRTALPPTPDVTPGTSFWDDPCHRYSHTLGL
jgi:hypothetical protein